MNKEEMLVCVGYRFGLNKFTNETDQSLLSLAEDIISEWHDNSVYSFVEFIDKAIDKIIIHGTIYK